MPGMVWSPDGICRPFSDEASGTVPADGAAVVLLVSPRAAAALYRQRDATFSGAAATSPKDKGVACLRRPAYAQVSGVGLNNDGRRKSGFCQPSSKGQVECLQLALKDANYLPGDVDYVEAHGTGTRVGDPIEVSALAQVFQDRQTRSALKQPPSSSLDNGSAIGDRVEENPARKLLVGSAKGNIGHLNTASGAAGFVKACLVAHHGRAPPTAHLANQSQLNKLVDWSSLPLEVVTKESHSASVLTTTAPSVDGLVAEMSRVNRVGVSAFGIGGTNVHILLSATSASGNLSSATSTAAPHLPPRPSLQLVSAASPAIATKFLAQLTDADPRNPIDSFTFEQALLDRARCGALCTVGTSGVRTFQLANTSPDQTSFPKSLPAPVPLTTAPRPVVLVFPGQGGAYEGMGKALIQAGLLSSLDYAPSSSILDVNVPWTSAESIVSASLAVADAILRHLSDGPLKVCAVLGHSLGEWSAAAFTGTIARDKALKLARRRDSLVSDLHRNSDIQRSNNSSGEIAVMIAVRTSAASLSKAPLGPLPNGLEVSVVNGADAVVVGGLLPECKLSVAAANILGLPVSRESRTEMKTEESKGIKGVHKSDEDRDEDIEEVEDSIGAWLKRLDAASVGWRRVQATTAFHSPAVDPLCKPYEESLRSMMPLDHGEEKNFGNNSTSTSGVPLISTVTGKYAHSISEKELSEPSDYADLSDPAYWVHQIRAPVRFDLALQTVAEDYPDALIVEVGPSALAGLITASGKSLGAKWQVCPTMRKQRHDNSSGSKSDNSDECATFLTCLGQLWTHGGPVPNLSAPRGKASLPTYDFSLHHPSINSTSGVTVKHHHSQIANGRAIEEHASKVPKESVTYEPEEEVASPSPTTTVYQVAWKVVIGGIATAAAPVLLPVVLLDIDDDGDSEETRASTNAESQEICRRAVQFLSEIGLSAVAPCYKLICAKDAAKAAGRYGCLALVGGLAQMSANSSTQTVDAQWVSNDWQDASGASAVTVRAVKVLAALGMSAMNESSRQGPIDLFVLLQGSPRYSCVRGALRSARKEQPGLLIRSVTLHYGSNARSPCLNGSESGTAKEQTSAVAKEAVPPVWSAQALLPALPMEILVDTSGVINLPHIIPLNLEEPKGGGNMGINSSISSSIRSQAPPSSCRVAVVSGGMRGLGLRVADALLKDGRVNKVVLLGRSVPADAIPSKELKQSSADASLLADVLARGGEMAACDVCDWAAVDALKTTVRPQEEVTLVVHCAGVVKDALLARTTDEDAISVLAPKVAGTLNLRRKWPQARFLGFSSSSAALGPAGQATYAGANAFVDEWLAWEKYEGDCDSVQSVQWGGWGGAGMSADLNISPLQGEKFFDVSTGLAHLASVLDSMGVCGDADDKNTKDIHEGYTQQGAIALPSTLPAALLAMDVDWPSYATNPMVSSPPEAGDNLLAHVIVPRTKRRSAVWTAGGWRSSLEAQSRPSYTLAFGPGSDAINGSETAWKWGSEERLELQHVVDGVPILPGSAYLCWALSALHHERELLVASPSTRPGSGDTAALHTSAPLMLSDVRFLKPLDLLIRRDCTLNITFDKPGASEMRSGSLLIACGAIVHASMRFEPLLSDDASSNLSATSAASGAASLLCNKAEVTCSVEYVKEVPSPNEVFQSQGFGYGATFSQLSHVRTVSGTARASLKLPTPDVSATGAGTAVDFLTAGLVDSSLQLASLVDGGVMGVPSKIERFSWWPLNQQVDESEGSSNGVVGVHSERKLTAAVVLEESTAEKVKSKALPTFQLSVCRAQRPVFFCSGLALFPLGAPDDDNNDMAQFASESPLKPLAWPPTSLRSPSCLRIGVGFAINNNSDDAFAHIEWYWKAATLPNGDERGSVDAVATAEAANMLRTVAATRPLSAVLLQLPTLASASSAASIPKAKDGPAAIGTHRISVDEAVSVLVAAARDLGLKAYADVSNHETVTVAKLEQEAIDSASDTEERNSENLLWADGTMVAEDLSAVTSPPLPPKPQAWDSPLVACVDASDSEKLEAGGAWFETCNRKPALRPHEVEVLATSWALNFRDVLVAQGAIPTDTAGAQLGIGGECGGVVVRVGGGVKHVQPGDAVACVPPDGMGSYLVTRMEWVSPPLYRPTSYPSIKHHDSTASSLLESSARAAAAEVASHVEAAAPPSFEGQDSPALSLPVWPDASGAASSTLAYATAWLALVDGPGRVKPCEIVLLHSAAGGVGLAALQLLQSRFVGNDGKLSPSPPNIVVYGTASTESKRQLLLELGCKGAFDSRDPQAFSRGVRHAEAQRLSEEAQRLSAAAKVAQASFDAAANTNNNGSTIAVKLQRRAARAVGRAKMAKAAAVRASAAAAQADKLSHAKDQQEEKNFEGVEGCVDVILGAVAGAAFDTSLSLLKPFGRFIELGKRSGYEKGSLPASVLLKGAALVAAHLDVLMLTDRPRAAKLFRAVWEAQQVPSHEGGLPPLPLDRVFTLSQLPESLKHMSQGTHVGKVVLINGPNTGDVPCFAPQHNKTDKKSILENSMSRLALKEVCSFEMSDPMTATLRSLVTRPPLPSLQTKNGDEGMFSEVEAAATWAADNESGSASEEDGDGEDECYAESDDETVEKLSSALRALSEEDRKHPILLKVAVLPTLTVEAATSFLQASSKDETPVNLVIAGSHAAATWADVTLRRRVQHRLTGRECSSGDSNVTPPLLVVRVRGEDWVKISQKELQSTLVLAAATANGDRPSKVLLVPSAAANRQRSGGTHGNGSDESMTMEDLAAAVVERETWLRQAISGLAGVSPDNVDKDEPFEELGVDSLAQINLARRVGARFNLQGFGVGDLLKHNTIASLLAYTEERIAVLVKPAASYPRPPPPTVNDKARPDHDGTSSHGTTSSKEVEPTKLPTLPTVALPVALPSALRRASASSSSKGRVLCLHGFRSSGELLQVAIAPLLASIDSATTFINLSYDFLDAPHSSNGDPEPGIPSEVPTYEWWGIPHDSTYEDGWQRFGPRALYQASREKVLAAALDPVAMEEKGPVVGLIGFSQGAAMCVALASDPQAQPQLPSLQFVGAFSAVPPRNIQTDAKHGEDNDVPAGCPPLPGALHDLSSFHSFDPKEKHAQLCREVHTFFEASTSSASKTSQGEEAKICEVLTHNADHSIPRKGSALTDLAKAFRGFLGKIFEPFE